MLALDIQSELWPLKEPFRISGYTFTECEDIRVSLRRDGVTGFGESSGVYYLGETPKSMAEQIEAARGDIEADITRDRLREILPPGGARNAVDCALWDLEAKRTGSPCWQIAGIAEPAPLVTTFTIGAGKPQDMAEQARSYTQARAIKVKLTGKDDGACVRAIREARPDVWIGVDANQGLTRKSLEKLLPELKVLNVGLIEQPLPIETDHELEGLRSPIPIAADESAQDSGDIKELIGRYDVVNIKLDKCGGLTEGLQMARMARRVGLKVMVGCMAGTSLAMAPAYLLGQLCDFVDLDAPLFLAEDREAHADYIDGQIRCPEAIWGGPLKRGERRAAT